MGGFVQLGIAGKAIVRGDELPFAGDFHPDVGEAIAIVVGFLAARLLSRGNSLSLPSVQRTPVRSDEEAERREDLVGKGWDGMDFRYSNILKRSIIERCKSMLMFCLRDEI